MEAFKPSEKAGDDSWHSLGNSLVLEEGLLTR